MLWSRGGWKPANSGANLAPHSSHERSEARIGPDDKLRDMRSGEPAVPSYSTAQAVATLIPAVGGKAQELPLHRIDPGEIGRDEVIAAALAGHQVKTTAHEGLGGTCAAEMDECGEILFLLRACRHIARAGENAATLRSRYTAASSMAWLGIARI